MTPARTYSHANAVDHVKEARQRLQDSVDALLQAEGWANYLRFQARFHDYSWGNAMLIRSQCPHATRVKGYQGWLGMGRQVKKGEKGIRILAPRPYKTRVLDPEGDEIEQHNLSFTTVAVFDISQTEAIEGHPNPYIPGDLPYSHALESGDEIHAMKLFGVLHRHLIADGCDVTILAHPDRDGAHGCFSPRPDAIRVVQREACPMLSTLIHETAHRMTHGALGGRASSYAQHEVVAEAVTFIVCDWFGIESLTPSTEYVAGWLTHDTAAFKRGMTLIQKTAHELIETMERASARSQKEAA